MSRIPGGTTCPRTTSGIGFAVRSVHPSHFCILVNAGMSSGLTARTVRYRLAGGLVSLLTSNLFSIVFVGSPVAARTPRQTVGLSGHERAVEAAGVTDQKISCSSAGARAGTENATAQRVP